LKLLDLSKLLRFFCFLFCQSI